VFEKSVRGPFFYRPKGVSDDDFERFESMSTTAGPWTPDAQHGGPPAALLARSIERLEESADRVIGRYTMELWGRSRSSRSPYAPGCCGRAVP
jgi:hypothetical protein